MVEENSPSSVAPHRVIQLEYANVGTRTPLTRIMGVMLSLAVGGVGVVLCAVGLNLTVETFLVRGFEFVIPAVIALVVGVILCALALRIQRKMVFPED